MLSRRTLRRTGIGLALAAVLDTAVWWWMSGRVITLFTAWQANQVAEGYAITTAPAGRAGWPFWAEAAIPDVMMATAPASQTSRITWRSASLRLTYVPWRPNVFTAAAIGPQSLQAGDGPSIPITAAYLAATIPLDPAHPSGLVVEAHSLTATLPPGTLSAERLSLRLQPDGVDMAVTMLMLPSGLTGGPLPFGGTVDTIALHAQATVMPPQAASVAAALAAWRRAGGELQLSNIAVRWGPLEAQGAATLTLDAALQPQGTGTIRMTGYQDMVDALQRTGTISRSAASVASAMLGLLSSGAPDKPREVNLPLRLENGVVSAGAIPILRVPKFIPPS